MKKITKKDLRGLKQLFPMLGKAEMRHYVGGYSNGYWNGNWNNPYSYFDYGGYTGYNDYYYDGSGYRLPEVTVYGYYPNHNQGGGDFWPIFPNGPLENPNAGYPYSSGQQDYNGNPRINGNPGYGYYGYYGYYDTGYYGGGSGGNVNSDDASKRGDIIDADWACMFNCMNYLDSSKSAQEYYEYFTSIFRIDAFEEGGLPYEYHVTALRACGFSCEETSSITGGGYHFLAIIDPGNGRTHAVIITEKDGDLVTIYDPSIISDKPEDKSYKVHVGRIKTMYKVK
jgi:hypothetical protein